MVWLGMGEVVHKGKQKQDSTVPNDLEGPLPPGQEEPYKPEQRQAGGEGHVFPVHRFQSKIAGIKAPVAGP